MVAGEDIPAPTGHAADADLAGGMVGKRLEEAYGGYFRDLEIARPFLRTCEEAISGWRKDRLDVLGIGSGDGFLEELVASEVRKTGRAVTLTISDILEAGLADNANPSTIKMVVDNKALPFPDESFGLVLARSVTHYERSPEDEMRTLREIRRVMRPEGALVDQAPAFSTSQEAALIREIHLLVGKPMNLADGETVMDMLQETFGKVTKVSTAVPSLEADLPGFLQRYGVPLERHDEVAARVSELVGRVVQEARPNLRGEGMGIGWSVPYTIYVCRNS